MKGTMVIGLVLVAMPVWAQPPAASPSETVADERVVERELRIQRMEQLLEQAVTRGVRAVEQHLPAVAPQLLFFAGPVQARGFVVDGYGLFFDVEYPVIRRSLLWSMNALDAMDGGMSAALRDLRSRMSALPDGPEQAALQAIAEMEAELQGARMSRAAMGGNGVRTTADADVATQDERTVADPRELYLSALTVELTDAMVAFGSALGVAEDEWLSVAARDGRGRSDPRLAGPRPTLHLRIGGDDLDALRRGAMSPEEVRARVEIP